MHYSSMLTTESLASVLLTAVRPYSLSCTISRSFVKPKSNESVLCIRWPKYWSFSFSISPSNEYSGLISFRIDWFDLLSVQETLRSLLQLHNLKASILQCSAFFMVQLSHLYLTTGKTMAPNYLRPATMTLSSSFSLMILPSLRDSTVSSVWNGFPTPCPAEEGPHFFFQGLLRPPGQNESLASVCFLIFLKRAWKQAMFFFFFWPYPMACGILVPPPRIERTRLAVEAQSLNHWTTREVLCFVFNYLFVCVSVSLFQLLILFDNYAFGIF